MEINLAAPIYIPDWVIPLVVGAVLIFSAWWLYRIFFPKPCFEFPEKMGMSSAREKEVDEKSEERK